MRISDWSSDVCSSDLANTIYRVTPAGVISVFLSEAELEAVAGGSIDLEGGIWFDSDGNFYVTDNDTDSVYKFFSSDPAIGAVDPASGILLASEADIIAALGAANLDGGAISVPGFLLDTVDANPWAPDRKSTRLNSNH